MIFSQDRNAPLKVILKCSRVVRESRDTGIVLYDGRGMAVYVVTIKAYRDGTESFDG